MIMPWPHACSTATGTPRTSSPHACCSLATATFWPAAANKHRTELAGKRWAVEHEGPLARGAEAERLIDSITCAELRQQL
jgi:hypothetical protein